MGDTRRVAYFYDGTVYTENIGNFYYGQGHPMKPHRVRMTHQLILAYKLYRHMDVYRPHYASREELMLFHTPSHVKFLERAETTGEKQFILHEKAREDCPIFENMYEFSQICAGASIDCAMALNQGEADICINWSGGFHHAKKGGASGFCYVNDIVLGILELLKYHERVLYLDIDAHHGDGVEEAFYTTNRVMTVSFHKFGNFFPGTGDIKDIGAGEGKYYCLNIPLRSGMDDEGYMSIFKPIMREVVYFYQPNVVVMQCGSDSLAHDKLGKFNLTIRGHGECLNFMKGLGLPMMVVGGGGYTISNVSRCWAYETGVCLNMMDMDNAIPQNDYYQYFGPSYSLHIEPDSNLENKNHREYLETALIRSFEHLKQLEGAPSVPMQDLLSDFFPDGLKKRVTRRDPTDFYD